MTQDDGRIFFEMELDDFENFLWIIEAEALAVDVTEEQLDEETTVEVGLPGECGGKDYTYVQLYIGDMMHVDKVLSAFFGLHDPFWDVHGDMEGPPVCFESTGGRFHVTLASLGPMSSHQRSRLSYQLNALLDEWFNYRNAPTARFLELFPLKQVWVQTDPHPTSPQSLRSVISRSQEALQRQHAQGLIQCPCGKDIKQLLHIHSAIVAATPRR